jgi:hypothetical protein
MELVNSVKSRGCGTCGGKMVFIRGKYPGDKNRKVCPTCSQERLEDLLSNLNNTQAKEILR